MKFSAFILAGVFTAEASKLIQHSSETGIFSKLMQEAAEKTKWQKELEESREYKKKQLEEANAEYEK